MKSSKLIMLRFGVSQFFIGSTVIAITTSMPEFFVSMIAIARSQPVYGVTNAIGSSNINTLLILLVLTIFIVVEIDSTSLRSFVFLVILSLFLWLGSAFFVDILTHQIPRYTIAGLLLCGYVFFLVVVPRLNIGTLMAVNNSTSSLTTSSNRVGDMTVRSPQDASEKKTITRGGLVLTFLGLPLSGFLLYISSELFLLSAIYIGETHLMLSQKVIGIVFVALGTSLPELSVILYSLFSRSMGSASLGNILGSNAFNIMVILGTMIAFVDLGPSLYLMRWDALILLLGIVAAGIIFLPLKHRRLIVSLLLGFLLIFYCVFIIS